CLLECSERQHTRHPCQPLGHVHCGYGISSCVSNLLRLWSRTTSQQRHSLGCVSLSNSNQGRLRYKWNLCFRVCCHSPSHLEGRSARVQFTTVEGTPCTYGGHHSQ